MKNIKILVAILLTVTTTTLLSKSLAETVSTAKGNVTEKRSSHPNSIVLYDGDNNVVKKGTVKTLEDGIFIFKSSGVVRSKKSWYFFSNKYTG